MAEKTADSRIDALDFTKIWTDNNYCGEFTVQYLLPLPVGMRNCICPKCQGSRIYGAKIMPTADECDPNIICLDCGYWWD